MGLISDKAAVWLRKYVVDGVPASGINQPSKEDGLATLNEVDLEVGGGYVGYATWDGSAGLAAHPGTTQGETGKVLNDTGTHTDPTNGNTVANPGVYSWTVASPSGWKWVATLDADAARAWAIQTGAAVVSGLYSAKEWAVGTFLRGTAGGGSAKDWAIYTGGTVDNAGYSSLYSANASAASAASAASVVAGIPATLAKLKADLLFLGAIPAGASGVWFADEASLPVSAELRAVIPNMATAVAPSANLFGAPKRLFNNATYWTKYGTVTVTDANAVDWRGVANQASTIALSGGAFMRPVGFQAGGTDTLPAGRYSCVVIARAASSQSWRMTDYGHSTHSGTLTATTSDQAFVWTFDWAGGTIHFFPFDTIDGSTAATLIVSLAGLWSTPGRATGVTTVAPGSTGISGVTDPLAAHMYLGYANTDPKPVISGAAFDQSGGAYGLIQFDQPQALTAFTCIAITQKTAENGAFGGVFSKVQTYSDLTVSTEYNEAGYSQNGPGLDQHLLSPSSDLSRWQAYHEVYDGAKDTLGLNGVGLRGYSVTGTKTVSDAWSGIVASTGASSKNKLAGMMFWPRALSNSELLTAVNQAKARIAISGLSLSARKFYIAEGHSIPQGGVLSPRSTAYTYQQGPVCSPQINGANFSEAGDAMVHIKTRLAMEVALVTQAVAAGYHPIISVMMGRNDFTLGTTPTAYCADISLNYLAPLRAAGAYIILETVLPFTANGGTAWRHSVNTTYRTWVGTYCDVLMDWDTVTGIGGDDDAGTHDSGSTTPTTNYLDGTHPNATGNALLIPYITALINAAPS